MVKRKGKDMQYTIRIKNSRWEKLENGGRSVPLPDTFCDVEVDVDLASLAKTLGVKAVRSKGKRSVDAGGLVRVTVVREHGENKPEGLIL